MNYQHHPLNKISDHSHVGEQPETDFSVFESRNRPNSSLKSKLKKTIGIYLYPILNKFQMKSSLKKLHKTSGFNDIEIKPDVISWGLKGSGQEVFLINVAKKIKQKNFTVLCFGCGLGDETLNVARYLSPSRIIAVDYFNYKTYWDNIKLKLKNEFNVESEFFQLKSDGSNIGKLNNAIDVVYSSAVLEHIKNMDTVFEKINKWLKPGGFFTAQWGPMWYSFSGDHISGELGLEKAFEHDLLNAEDYFEYYKNHPRNKQDVIDGKLTWLQLGLHNFATYHEYMQTLKTYFNNVLFLHWVIMPKAFLYKRKFPSKWDLILKKNPFISELDLILTGAGIVLQKNSEEEN